MPLWPNSVWARFVAIRGPRRALQAWAGLQGQNWDLDNEFDIICELDRASLRILHHDHESSVDELLNHAVLVAPRERIRRGLPPDLLLYEEDCTLAQLDSMKASLSKDALSTDLFATALEFVIGQHLGAERFRVVKRLHGDGPRKSEALDRAINAIALTLPMEQREVLFYRGSRSPRAQRRRRLQPAKHEGNLYVNGHMLCRLLFNTDRDKVKDLATAIYQAETSGALSVNDDSAAMTFVFICSDCGAIHEIIASQLHLPDVEVRPTKCGSCRRSSVCRLRVPYPDECMYCKSCAMKKKVPFHFSPIAPDGEAWNDEYRDIGLCSRHKCRQKLFPSATKKDS